MADTSPSSIALNPNGQAASANSSPVTPATDSYPNTSYAPFWEPMPSGGSLPNVDPAGNLSTRTQILTDEGGYRANFANSSLAVTIGTCTFTNGSANVTGTGFDTVDLHVGDYVYLTSDGNQFAVQVDELTDTTITLSSAYQGTSGTGAASRQYLNLKLGTGTSHSVSGGIVTLTSGSTNSAIIELERDVDYLPLVKVGQFSISQRIANQNIYYGFYDENSGNAARWYYWFDFNGTTNTAVQCVCAWNPTTAPSGGEISATTVTLPAGVTTAASNTYRIEVLKDRVVFYINEIPVRTERSVVPHPTDFLTSTCRIANGTGASSTNVVMNYDGCSNFNVASVENPSNLMAITNPNVPAQDDVVYSVAGVITINTNLAFIDCTQYRAISVQCVSMGTSGVVTPAFSNDGGTTWVGGALIPSAGGALVTTFNAAGLWVVPVTGKLMRLRLTTATTAGTTTLRASGMHQIPNIIPSSLTVTASNLSCNNSQWGGQTPLNPAMNGSTNRAVVVGIGGPTSNTDYSAQAWAAASGSGAVIAEANGLGLGAAFDVNLTAWTAGSSTGLDIYLQESPDNGTTYYDIWQCEALTAVSRARIPALPIGGRRRMRWVNRTGAATTATVTVTAMEVSGLPIKQVQWFDRTANVTSGTAALGNGAAYDIAGCKAMTFAMQTGTATGAASFKIQMSMDGSNWYDASAAVSCPASSMTPIPLTSGVFGRFARFVCTVAGTSALVTAGHIYGTN